MNTNYLVLLLVVVTIITVSMPSIAEVIAEAIKPETHTSFPEVREAVEPPPLPESFVPPKIEISDVRGHSYVISKNSCDLTQPGEAGCGIYRTELDGILELKLGSDSYVILHPETEMEIAPLGASWPSVLNVKLKNGEIDVITTRADGRNIRVLTDGICINPDNVRFKVTYKAEVSSGEIVVKSGILRATADADPNRFCSISTSYGINFEEGLLKIPERVPLKSYVWRFNR
ncbi:MAG: hypothetical protein Kow0029_00070 [Candidatus Rifleibacteriota bacterium]